MPETYTRTNFNPSVIPSSFKPETRKTIELAVAVGWKFLVTDAGHATIIAPNEAKRFHMNAKNAEAGPVQSIRRQVLTHGDPKLVAKLEDREATEREQRMAQVRREEAEALAKAEAEGARKRAEMGLSAPQPAEKADPQPSAPEAAEQRFPCPEDECPKVFVSAAAMRGHQKVHKQADPNEGNTPTLPEITVSARVPVEEVANGTKVTAADGTVHFQCAKCPKQSATFLGLQSHQKTHNETGGGRGSKRMSKRATPEQILERVRHLVGAGEVSQADYDAVVAERDALQEKYDALEKDHKTLRENLAAFKDLLP